MRSCIYEGRVRHRRFSPVEHAFEYRMFMMYLDLDELPTLFRRRWLWSADRFNLACFNRRDHHGPASVPLADAIRGLVRERTGTRPAGAIRLLTHLRYFGYGFNPVSFYYCFNAEDTGVEFIVAEVNNTPWNEQHCYVFAANDSSAANAECGMRNAECPDAPGPNAQRQRDPAWRFEFPKQFHVSPFMDMNVRYDWRFGEPGELLAVHMLNFDGEQPFFDSALTMMRREISGVALARVLARYPLMTLRVIAGIYWQAFRLHLKRCPSFVHPSKRPAATEAA